MLQTHLYGKKEREKIIGNHNESIIIYCLFGLLKKALISLYGFLFSTFIKMNQTTKVLIPLLDNSQT